VLLRAIALNAVTAWRIMLLALLGRVAPGLPCDLLFNRCECEVLELWAAKKLSVYEATIVIAKLGGYLHRHRDAAPGFECIRKGYSDLSSMAKMLQLYHASGSKSRRLMRCRKPTGQAQAKGTDKAAHISNAVIPTFSHRSVAREKIRVLR
jgi:hypothetical protein